MKARFLPLLLLVFATSAFAHDRLSLFVTQFTHSDSAGGFGVGYAHSWNDQWSMEASLTAERRHMLTTNFVFGPSGSLPSTERVTVDTFPVDVTGRYHFTNRSRFQPYVSAGLRYVHAPDNIHEPIILTQPLTPISSIVVKPYANRTSAEVGGGLSFRMTDHVSLQGDVKRLLRNDSAPFDPLTRTSFGLSFKF